MLIMAKEARFLRVSEIRERKGMSVEEMASKAEIAYNTALSYDRDSSELISKKILKKIASALDVNVRDLISEDANNGSGT